MKKKNDTSIVPASPRTAPNADANPDAPKKGISIEEYEQKYVTRENTRTARFTIGFGAAVIGVFLFAVLALLALRCYDINEYLGYGVGAACLVLYVLVYIVPVVKILRTGYFVTNVNAFTAKKAQRHNRKVRHEVADKIIDLTARVDGVGWYDSAVVGRLAVAMKARDEAGIRRNLTELYNGSVKKSAKSLIRKSALKAAAYSAISQTALVDTALVVTVNMQLIKDLVFLFGFRPSDAKLARIFRAVVRNSLIAYGVGATRVGGVVVRTLGDAVSRIPILGSAISALIDSSIQGFTNGALTTVIGYQTIRYLFTEYRLQDILDDVSLEGMEVEVQETISELEKELKAKKKNSEAA